MTEQEQKIKEIGWAEAAIDTLYERGKDSEAEGVRCVIDELLRVTARAEGMECALQKIKGGLIDGDDNAPDPMTCDSKLDFGNAMWSWSQNVARQALQDGEK